MSEHGEPYRPRRASPLVARLVPLRGDPTQAAVLAELRRVILAGDAPPGTVVPLDEVAAVLGMSVGDLLGLAGGGIGGHVGHPEREDVVQRSDGAAA